MIKAAINSIMQITPYKAGTSSLSGQKSVIKLSSNENPFGVSPMVVNAIKRAAKNIYRYPESSCGMLRKAIADLHKIDKSRIICGAGSDELIALLCQAFAADGDEILYNEYGFLMYPISALRCGATPVTCEEINLKIDVDNLLAKVSDKTKIIFIANANNPTGSYINQEETLKIITNVPDDIIIVFDEAYAEFANAEDYMSGLKIVDKYPNLVVLRTFSKIYGMGGMRLGWAYAGEKIVDILSRVRGPFNVSSLAICAGIAAIEDQDFIVKSVEHNTVWREKLTTEISDLGFKVYPSQANFILVEFISQKQSETMDRYLKTNGIIVRQMHSYKLPACLRITIGKQDENLKLIELFKGFRK